MPNERHKKYQITTNDTFPHQSASSAVAESICQSISRSSRLMKLDAENVNSVSKSLNQPWFSEESRHRSSKVNVRLYEIQRLSETPEVQTVHAQDLRNGFSRYEAYSKSLCRLSAVRLQLPTMQLLLTGKANVSERLETGQGTSLLCIKTLKAALKFVHLQRAAVAS